MAEASSRTLWKGAVSGLGALLLRVHDDQGKLIYAGNVGTGFDHKMLKALTAGLEKLGASTSPFGS